MKAYTGYLTFGTKKRLVSKTLVAVARPGGWGDLQNRLRLRAPLLDRIDIQVEVPAVRYKELADRAAGEGSEAIRARVDAAQKVQLARFDGRAIFCNAEMTPRDLRKHCLLADDAERLLEMAMNKLSLSARAYTRILKVARTIADLEGVALIGAPHVSEAIQYRSLDREL